MANHKSAIKRHRQSLKRNERNRARKSEIWTLTKKVMAAPKEEAVVLLKTLQSRLDKAGKRNIFHKRNAGKKIAKLMKVVAAK